METAEEEEEEDYPCMSDQETLSDELTGNHMTQLHLSGLKIAHTVVPLINANV